VRDRAISLRLDRKTTEALRVLTADGRSQSEAIRQAVLETARRQLYEQARTDAARLAADENDRREVAAVQALMEALSEEG
jgi:Arc/MetJ-type ribon-helix-helix transcriptional regulator